MEPLSATAMGEGTQLRDGPASESESSQSEEEFEEEAVAGGEEEGGLEADLAGPVEDQGYGTPPPLDHPWADTCRRAQATFRRYLHVRGLTRGG